MDLKTLKTFQVVAEELNLSKAAVKLNYSQPTVSKHIQQLEHALGVDLLQRVDGQYQLTPAGYDLYNHSLVIAQEMHAINKLVDKQEGMTTLRLQGHDYFCYEYFVPAIQRMSSANPHVNYQMKGSNNQATITALLKNECDLGIVSGSVMPSVFQATQIGVEQVAMCVNDKIYREGFQAEDYIRKYPIVIDQSEHYNTNNIFPYMKLPLRIIDTSSDEVVEKAILHSNMIGIVRTGRLQEAIAEGHIYVIETIISKEPIYLLKNRAAIHNAAANAFYEVVSGLNQAGRGYTMRWT